MRNPYNIPLHFKIGQDDAELFALLFQYGVGVKCAAGVTIEGLLVDQFGIAPEYLEKRLTTVFLNGSPVDDIGTTLISYGMTLALSSSMPGLAGATLRRKGALSSMRRSITYHDTDAMHRPIPAHDAHITIKLFNILAGEIGPVLLRRGISVEARKLAEFISLSPHKVRLVSAMTSETERDPAAFVTMLRQYDTRLVEIETGP